VLTAAFTPIPPTNLHDRLGAMDIGSDAFHTGFDRRSWSALLHRRLFLLLLFGKPEREFIERYFDRLALLFVVLLIGGFIV